MDTSSSREADLLRLSTRAPTNTMEVESVFYATSSVTSEAEELDDVEESDKDHHPDSVLTSCTQSKQDILPAILTAQRSPNSNLHSSGIQGDSQPTDTHLPNLIK